MKTKLIENCKAVYILQMFHIYIMYFPKDL
jgi:hypothetical protein